MSAEQDARGCRPDCRQATPNLLSIRDVSGKRVGQSFSTPREIAPARVS
jgi:hypothetical protein